MMPQPQPAAPQGGEQQAMIKQKLMELLSQAKAIADKNGIDFGEILAGFMQKGGEGRPPMPPKGGGMGMMG